MLLSPKFENSRPLYLYVFWLKLTRLALSPLNRHKHHALFCFIALVVFFALVVRCLVADCQLFAINA